MKNSLRLRLVLATPALLAASLGTTLALASPTITLGTRRVLPLTDIVNGAALGDFDEDSITDIAALQDSQPPKVQIFRGLGSGHYVLAGSIVLPGRPYEAVTADLNHDGHIDLTIVGTGPALTILLGSGNGSFDAPVTYGSSQYTEDLALADLNGDGHLDVALTHAFTNTVSVFFGTGTGTFGPEQSITIPATDSHGVVIGDFKVDGHVDIAVGAGGVVVLPGDGQGGFGAPVQSVGLASSGMTAHDVDGDGLTDLVVANPTTGSIQVLGSAGDGTFSVKGSFPVTSGIDALAIGDLNGDGHADVVAGGTGDKVYVLLATGPGAFGSPVPFRAGNLPDTLIVADLDEDGRQDILAGNTLGRELAILPGDGRGGLAAELSIPLTWSQSPDVAAADFNEDGRADIAVLNSDGPFGFECGLPPGPISCDPRMLLTFVPHTGPASFGTPVSSPTRCAARSMAVADFNRDGHLDVATANRGARDAFGICYAASLSILKGNGNGGFGNSVDLLVADVPDIITAGDFNEDGYPDLVVSFHDGLSVRVYLGGPGGAINPVSALFLGSGPRGLAVGDLDSDGHLDVAAALPDNGHVAILRGDGTGHLNPIAECAPGSGGGVPTSLAIGDFDGDNDVDIAVTIRSTVVVMHRSGSSFCVAPSETIPIPTSTARVSAGDLDNDGVPDLLVSDNNTRLTVLRGAPPLQSAVPDTYGAYYSQAIAMADFDDDGLLDVAVTSTVASSVSVVRNITAAGQCMFLSLDGSMVTWTGVAGSSGYDLVRGSLRILRGTGGNYTSALQSCVASDVATTFVDVSDNPEVGDGWWFLGRSITAGGPGSYDCDYPGQVGSSDAEIAASPLTCP